MPIERKPVGEMTYHGRKIEVKFMGPDLLAYVDGIELSGFYLDSQAAYVAGQKHVDAELLAEAERKKKTRSKT